MIERETTFDGFMAAFDPDGTRVIADITPVRDADGNSPFVVVRHGRFAAVLCLMPFSGDDGHLCIDVHPFADGQDATAAPFGMTDGRRVQFPPTGKTSHGWPATHGVSVLIGKQAAVFRLNWYTSASADEHNHDQEVDLDHLGSPGDASWASVSPGGSQDDPARSWTWEIFDRWLLEDEDGQPAKTLAYGTVADETAAKLAVENWVAAMQAKQAQEAS